MLSGTQVMGCRCTDRKTDRQTPLSLPASLLPAPSSLSSSRQPATENVAPQPRRRKDADVAAALPCSLLFCLLCSMLVVGLARFFPRLFCRIVTRLLRLLRARLFSQAHEQSKNQPEREARERGRLTVHASPRNRFSSIPLMPPHLLMSLLGQILLLHLLLVFLASPSFCLLPV